MIALSSRRKSCDIWISDGSWSKFTWIERECDFTFHDLQEPQTLWMTIFPIFVISKKSHSKIWHFFSQSHDELGKLSFMDFTFHTNGEKWNHIHAQFT